MHIIMLSGGSGKRLWPLSNEVRSKQFLKLFDDGRGGYMSMVQKVYSQLQAADIDAQIVVATGAAQVDSIQSQLGEKVEIVLEPERRDTFPAIVLSCLYLALEKKLGRDEAVTVLPVDPCAELDYFYTLKEMERAVKNDAADIVLMGVKPTYPSEKFGYIVSSGIETPGKVSYFVEKPDAGTAQKLISEGAVWNGGVFSFKLGYMLDIAKKYIQADTFETALAQYHTLKKTSFDYEVVEKADSLAMIRYNGYWKDLGTWNTITEEMDSSVTGKVIMADTCRGTHVINELGIPVVAMGLENVVVAASQDGILVADKHQSSYLKPIADRLDQRPMYEERRWGEYKVLDYNIYGDNSKSLTKHMFMKEGKKISYQSHKLRDEIWTFVDGTGYLLIDGHVQNVRRGDVAYITRGQKHAVKAISDLHFIEVQIGEELVESDIERFEWKW